MKAETSKIKAKLANLNASLGELESLLEPLLAQSLPETLVGLELIQQAKLQTVLPYIAYDLVFSKSTALLHYFVLSNCSLPEGEGDRSKNSSCGIGTRKQTSIFQISDLFKKSRIESGNTLTKSQMQTTHQ
jgi:hypothetical protein